ncbi:flagellar biosynthesis anti-sigma factor FlgM [Rhodoferax sp. WC2427]|uniref:flagellar biosynthesis anti-sigma factor FlgM n=1 Tax=Rhodoferax sp. WC2427 TaxID=3234144 RepID=UPI003465B761
MKIGQGIDTTAALNAAVLKKADQDKEAAPAGMAQKGARAIPAAGAQVSVSTLARTLEQNDRAVGSDFDSKKVADIKAAIKNGTFKINPEAIADKMLDNAQELLSVTR